MHTTLFPANLYCVCSYLSDIQINCNLLNEYDCSDAVMDEQDACELFETLQNL